MSGEAKREGDESNQDGHTHTAKTNERKKFDEIRASKTTKSQLNYFRSKKRNGNEKAAQDRCHYIYINVQYGFV